MHVVSRTSAGKTIKRDLIVVGKTAFSRIGSAKWTKSLRTDYERTIADIVRALQLVRNPALLRLCRPRDRRQAKAPSPDGSPNLHVRRGGRDDGHVRHRFDVWIEEDGTPVLIKGKVTTVVDYGIEIAGTLRAAHLEVRRTIKIVAPKN